MVYILQKAVLFDPILKFCDACYLDADVTVSTVWMLIGISTAFSRYASGTQQVTHRE